MSRPEDPRYVERYSQEQRKLLQVRPGSTGVASLKYHSEETVLSGDQWEQTYLKKVLPDKLAIELQYLKTRTVWKDLAIILESIFSAFKGR